jgi:23S rRNA C2498 (ribose-2'-O)-methylase RlmM
MIILCLSLYVVFLIHLAVIIISLVITDETGGVVQLVEHLSSKNEVLRSNTSAAEGKKCLLGSVIMDENSEFSLVDIILYFLHKVPSRSRLQCEL